MFEFSLYFVHSKRPNIHDFETETLGKKKILNDAIYALLFYLFSIFLPSAPMSLTQQLGSRSGQVLKGREQEQKEKQ